METTYTILIVDDEPVVRAAAQRILSAHGFTTGTAPDAETALALLPASAPDVLVIDLMLPGLSGFALLEQVKTHTPQTAGIVMTGYATVDHAVRALREGAFDFLPKPFTYDELLSPVYRACRYLAQQSAGFSPLPPETFLLGLQAWAKPEPDGSALLGLTDIFARTAGRIIQATLPETGAPMQQGGTLARLQADDDLTHDALSALSGQVLAVNPAWQMNPEQAAADPWETGWLVRIRPVDLAEELRRLAGPS